MVYAGGIDVSKPLIGTDEATLDDKFRITLTTRKMQNLGSDPVMALGKNDCLVLYPRAVWSLLIQEVMSAPTMHPGREAFTRCFLSTASDVTTFDQQNRFVIPADLRTLSKIDKGTKVKIAGCGDRIEIWAEEKWEAYQERLRKADRWEEREKAYTAIQEELIRSRHTKEREEQAKERGQ